MGKIEHPERDDAAVKVAEALWPNRHAGDLTTDDWKRCYAVVDAATDQLRGAVSDLLTFAQAILDMPCPFEREADQFAAQQRRASELITAYGGQ